MGLWLDSEGIMTNPSANDVISMALDALLEGVYPKAKGFVNKDNYCRNLPIEIVL